MYTRMYQQLISNILNTCYVCIPHRILVVFTEKYKYTRNLEQIPE